MKHAGPATLDVLEDVLAALRELEPLVEKSRGAFYLKGSGFLHFHEDPAGLFADLKVDGEWTRCSVDTAAQRKQLVRRAAELLTQTNRRLE